MHKTVAMMQPYLFPYLGYFQLIATSDAFVLGDNLQYVRGSWINRNRILVGGQPHLFTLPLKRGERTAPINQRWLCDDFDAEATALLKMLSRSYARAPHREQVLALVEGILKYPQHNLARFAEHSIIQLCRYLQIDTPLYRLSEMGIPEPVDKQERIIRLTRALGGKRYINPIGGTQLYCPAAFHAQGLELRFLRMDALTYPQLKHPFVPSLSIIDVLMFNAREQAQQLLERFSLCEGAEPADLQTASGFS